MIKTAHIIYVSLIIVSIGHTNNLLSMNFIDYNNPQLHVLHKVEKIHNDNGVINLYYHDLTATLYPEQFKLLYDASFTTDLDLLTCVTERHGCIGLIFSPLARDQIKNIKLNDICNNTNSRDTKDQIFHIAKGSEDLLNRLSIQDNRQYYAKLIEKWKQEWQKAYPKQTQKNDTSYNQNALQNSTQEPLQQKSSVPKYTFIHGTICGAIFGALSGFFLAYIFFTKLHLA